MVRQISGLNSQRWTEFRLEVFRRDNFTCKECSRKFTRIRTTSIERFLLYGKYYASLRTVFGYLPHPCCKDRIRIIMGSEKGLRADHIIPVAITREEWDINNLQTLCKKCHFKKTKQDMKDIWDFKKNLKDGDSY